MRKLYVRIYFAVLASLAVFALAAGLLWRAFGEEGPWSRAYEVAATLAQNALPPPSAPKAEQQAALERLAANLRADIALFAYTHCAADGGFDMKKYPAINAWLDRVRSQPRFVSLGT